MLEIDPINQSTGTFVFLFSELSLDKNPLHLDKEFAKSTVFGKRIVHGMFLGSLIS